MCLFISLVVFVSFFFVSKTSFLLNQMFFSCFKLSTHSIFSTATQKFNLLTYCNVIFCAWKASYHHCSRGSLRICCRYEYTHLATNWIYANILLFFCASLFFFVVACLLFAFWSVFFPPFKNKNSIIIFFLIFVWYEQTTKLY